MSLSQRLTKEPIRRYPQCTMGKLLDDLKEADREALLEALASDNWTARDISEALLAEGISMHPSTVRRHRRRECTCEPR